MHDFGAHWNASVISPSIRMRLFTSCIVLVIQAQYVYMCVQFEAYMYMCANNGDEIKHIADNIETVNSKSRNNES